MIEVAGLSYRYPRRDEPALSGLDLSIEAGTYLLITGPSGSGKSTLARSINGLVPHFYGGRFGGRVLVSGLDTRDHATATLSRHCAFVGQDPESQTVSDRVVDDVAFGVENLSLPAAEIRLRVEEALDLLGIAGLRHRTIASLSGGERQRVVIASAMAMRPSTLVLDEPTSQLDPWGAEEVLSVLDQMNAGLGLTVIVVEHRLERLLGVADRVLVLGERGVPVLLDDTIDALARLPEPPPFLRLARRLGWSPLPRTVKEARRLRERRCPAPLHVAHQPAPSNERASPVVELDRVSYGYGDRVVFEDLRLALRAGSVIALMGRNGSGKSTLLRLINGLIRPASGRVRLFGEEIARRSPAEIAGRVGYLPQNPGTLLFNRSVSAELEFTLRAQRRSGAIEQTLRRLGIADLADRNPLDLSGGQRQRAALAAILVGSPELVLLDEPTRGMDQRRKAELGRLLHELADQGRTVLLATHDVELVAESADRVIWLGDGGVVADGAPRSILPSSLTFAPQVSRVFGPAFLTEHDVLEVLARGQSVAE